MTPPPPPNKKPTARLKTRPASWRSGRRSSSTSGRCWLISPTRRCCQSVTLELALVTVSLLNKCTYCVASRAQARRPGCLGGGAERLLDYKDHPELDDLDRLVVEYAIAVTNNWNRTRDEIFDRLRQHFSEPQIVELTWRIALCGAFNRFNDILQFDIEEGVPVRDAAGKWDAMRSYTTCRHARACRGYPRLTAAPQGRRGCPAQGRA